MSAFSIMIDISEKYKLNWNTWTMADIMNDFIKDQNLIELFSDFVEEKAKSEKEMNDL